MVHYCYQRVVRSGEEGISTGRNGIGSYLSFGAGFQDQFSWDVKTKQFIFRK